MKLARTLLLILAAAFTYAALCRLVTHCGFPTGEIVCASLALGCWFGVGYAVDQSRRSMAAHRAQVWERRLR
jgi:hypothetical protein